MSVSALSPHTEPVWLTSEEAASRLRCPSVKAFYEWLRTHPDMPRGYRGRVLLFEARVLDAYVRGESWTKRRGNVHPTHTRSVRLVPTSTKGKGS